MGGRMIGPVVALALAALLAFAIWYSQKHPRTIVGAGSIVVTSKRPPFATITLNTRDISINGVVFKEVELPGGTWIDCAGDCPMSVRNAREDFWDTQPSPRK